MFEELAARLRLKAGVRVREVARRLVEDAGQMLPRGVAAASDPEGVRLSGKSLRQRMATDPALRSLWQRLR